jgi:glyoxylase-like metal-dependent hydrolase (beta-lactamase superfamily II)
VHPPFLNAGNAGPFTLDGTRTYRIGDRTAALIDPGPDVDDHVRAVAAWVSEASHVAIVLTHGHADHAGCATALAEALGAPVHGPSGVPGVDHPLRDGDEIATDQGTLVAIRTPGHTSDHLCFHWHPRRAIFAGDLLLGEGDTTWVAEYPGCVADYLASLERIRALAPEVIYPSHGPPIDDVPAVLARYEAHRRERIAQVQRALEVAPDASAEELLMSVYGPGLPPRVRGAARASLEALIDFVRGARPG